MFKRGGEVQGLPKEFLDEIMFLKYFQKIQEDNKNIGKNTY
jgi:hypothetical protein